jgi:hypothetical protein
MKLNKLHIATALLACGPAVSQLAAQMGVHEEFMDAEQGAVLAQPAESRASIRWHLGPDCWYRIKGDSQTSVVNCLGPSDDTNGADWYWWSKIGADGVAVRFNAQGRVTKSWIVSAPKPKGDHKVLKALGAIAISTFAVYECTRTEQKPLLWLTGSDMQWLQWCADNGL